MSKYSPINNKNNDNEQELDNLVLPTYSNNGCTSCGSSQDTFEQRLLALEAQASSVKPTEDEDEDGDSEKKDSSYLKDYLFFLIIGLTTLVLALLFIWGIAAVANHYRY
ncbi:hypothetical protein CJU90_0863 [Yarrowia sp. C11]|nr:hypothetical protein CKK34_2275 [Yarrowia sp. E02]KAG5373185.1 hypothetical protein CJU90_0863 [Yarrowia sp. C11]